MAGLDDFIPGYGGSDHPGDREIAELATGQHGIVAYWQLTALGLGARAIERRAQSGRLHRLYLGVYAVGHRRLTTRGRWMAAVLACGPDAVLSHRAAAALHDLRPIPSGPIDVTVLARGRRGQKGIRVHNVRRLDAEDRATVDGIPVTSVLRTLLDYAEVAKPQHLRHAVEAVERRGLLDGDAVGRLIERSRGRRGCKPLKAALEAAGGRAPWTQSGLEREFLSVVREAGIAEPDTNVLVEGELVDFVWRRRCLVVETDGYGFHRTRARFEADRRRDAKLLLAGWRVLRVTQERIEQEPGRLLSELRALLGGGAAGGGR